MHATATFDGQERVMTRGAYDLQVLATTHSASCGPGFVPDDYLEHLEGLAIETTLTAAELCAIGLWQLIDGGLPRAGLGSRRVLLNAALPHPCFSTDEDHKPQTSDSS
jgi:hypothetical protein